MIADQTNATGIAGVMGGEESEITESTTTVMFEIAAFDRTNIRLTTRALGLRTEASGRYERGVCAATLPVKLRIVPVSWSTCWAQARSLRMSTTAIPLPRRNRPSLLLSHA